MNQNIIIFLLLPYAIYNTYLVSNAFNKLNNLFGDNNSHTKLLNCTGWLTNAGVDTEDLAIIGFDKSASTHAMGCEDIGTNDIISFVNRLWSSDRIHMELVVD